MTNTIKATTMNISLTAEQEQWVKEKVASGRYNSRSEVIREALRLLEDQEQLREIKRETLREEIQKGLDDLKHGRSSAWDVEDVIRRGRERLEESCAPKEDSGV